MLDEREGDSLNRPAISTATAADNWSNRLSQNYEFNRLTLGELASAGVLGAVKATGFSAVAVTNGGATLSVVIGKADSLDKPEWKPVSTNDIPVEADSPSGFFIVAPQVPSDLDLPPIVTVK